MANDRVQLLITATDQTRAAFDSIKRNLGGLADAAKNVNGLLAGIGVSLSAAGLAAMAKSAIDAADQLNKLSQKIGISVESLSTLRYAAELSDVSLETLQAGIRGLSQNISEASTGIGDSAEMFKALGIAVKNADGSMKSTEDVLLQVANVFSKMEDGAVKSALAVKLFGRGGLEMIPFLNQGAAGINQLTAEAERLGLKLTTETGQAAGAFKDNLTALKAAGSSLGISLMNEVLPPLLALTTSMRDSASGAGSMASMIGGALRTALEAVLVLGANVAYVFKQVGNEIGGIAAQLAALARLDFKAFSTIGKMMKEDAEKARKEIDELSKRLLNPPKAASPSGQPASGPAVDMQRIACIANGGQWINGKCQKKTTATAKDTSAAQLAYIKAQADAEFAILKHGLDRAKAYYDAALEDRLISIKDYYAAKTQVEQREIDGEIARTQALLAEQKRLAVKGKDESERIRARGEVAKLENELIILNDKRAAVEQANARASAKAERELADALADAKLKLAEITGTATDADRRAAIERSYRDLRARLANDPEAVAVIDRLINVEAAKQNLQALEDQWRRALENMRNIEQSVNIQQNQGLITSGEAQAKIAAAHQEAAAALDELLPKMEAAAQAIGPDAVARVQAWKNELASVKDVVDPVASTINTAVKDAFANMFESIGTGAKNAKEAFLDFARSVIAAIQRIAAQKLAEEIFGSMKSGGGIGGWISGVFKFASGGPVPGSGTGDTVPAMLTPGEYVIRRDAVRRFGVGLLDAINGMRLSPGVMGGRLAFASGGLVPQVGGTVNNVSVVVNADGGRVQGDTQAAADLGRRIEAAVRGVLISEKRPGGLLAVA
jgi:hypothetical protein